ncbi:hypothetical protein BPA01_09590 [Brevibacillus parabrevis]|uniref:Uncharacterized protein n=1 Tax=Brevibacillus parabrevis TaxID=54914 RepID=A0A4Y3PJS3_BREPA|nr:hypothetical protein BPA01_09590 [Brevibacillus parabrevis]
MLTRMAVYQLQRSVLAAASLTEKHQSLAPPIADDSHAHSWKPLHFASEDSFMQHSCQIANFYPSLAQKRLDLFPEKRSSIQQFAENACARSIRCERSSSKQ